MINRKILAALLLFSLASCTNNCTRKHGGSMTIDLPKDRKLVNCAWNSNSLWMLTTEMSPTDTPRTYTYHEDSKWGIREGTVTLKESR